MKLFCCNIDNISTEHTNKLLDFLPMVLKEEIVRYRNPDDRKLRIIARLIVAYFFGGNLQVLNKWMKGPNHKPYIPGFDNFNISHSGKFVVVAFSTAPVGIDIECVQEIDVEAIAPFFSSAEIVYLKRRNFSLIDFYTIWTKKEAYLKALGIGVINGLDHVNVSDHYMPANDGSWIFNEIRIDAHYMCHTCSKLQDLVVELEDFDSSMLVNIVSCTKSLYQKD